MRNYGYSIIIVIALWKPVLLVFTTSESNPLMMTVWQLAETYISKSNCKIAISELDLKAAVKNLVPPHIQVIHSQFACVEDETGSAI